MSHPHEPVGEWWRGQVAALHRWGRLVLRDEDDSVHQMRVTARRLRSVLATYRPLLDSERTEPVREELKWIAALLGDVRDTEVLHDRLRRAAKRRPAPSGLDALRAVLAEREAEGRVQLLPELDGDRYHALLASLAVSDSLPWADGPPKDKALRKRVRHDWKRLVVAADTAADTMHPGSRREQLHETRKRAKRTRYAAEALREIYGKDAKRLAKAAKSIQSTLGDLNDAVLMMRTIEDLPARDDALLELLEAEETAARDAEERFASVWQKANRSKVHGWLSP